MAIQVHWDDEAQTIVRWEYAHPWTLEQFVLAVDEGVSQVKGRAERVDMIIHRPGLRQPPNIMSHVRRAMDLFPGDGLVVIVEDHLFIRMLVNSFTTVYPAYGQRLKVTRTIEEARALIAESRTGAALQG